MPGTYPCQTKPVRSGRSTACWLPALSKRQSSTRVATSEKRVKFTPEPSYCAPRG